ncbi:hypothetical protein HZA43_04925 [Candidatus Peregrinibacteria bacterium]|nr:hypothetical protein [Candidatus Peregrinibacteria bacterium]
MYNLVFHPTLAVRWQKFSALQRIFMIGNELNRALNARRGNDFENVKNALERAFELIDLTVQWSRSNQQKELLRLREVLADFYQTPDHFSESELKQICRTLLSFNAEAFDTLAEQYA